jgi:hypothetical protein
MHAAASLTRQAMATLLDFVVASPGLIAGLAGYSYSCCCPCDYDDVYSQGHIEQGKALLIKWRSRGRRWWWRDLRHLRSL